MPDYSEENHVPTEVVVAPTLENSQQTNVNKDFVDNTYEIYMYNAKECKFHKYCLRNLCGHLSVDHFLLLEQQQPLQPQDFLQSYQAN